MIMQLLHACDFLKKKKTLRIRINRHVTIIYYTVISLLFSSVFYIIILIFLINNYLIKGQRYLMFPICQ